MTYFMLEVVREEFDGAKNRHLTQTNLEFQCAEFGIAQAVFQSTAVRAENDEVNLYAIGAGEIKTLVADKQTFLTALRNQQQREAMQPGTPPIFRA